MRERSRSSGRWSSSSPAPLQAGSARRVSGAQSRSGVAASRCEWIGRDQDLYPMFDIVTSQPPIWRSRCQRCLRRKAAARQKPGASAFA